MLSFISNLQPIFELKCNFLQKPIYQDFILSLCRSEKNQ